MNLRGKVGSGLRWVCGKRRKLLAAVRLHMRVIPPPPPRCGMLPPGCVLRQSPREHRQPCARPWTSTLDFAEDTLGWVGGREWRWQSGIEGVWKRNRGEASKAEKARRGRTRFHTSPEKHCPRCAVHGGNTVHSNNAECCCGANLGERKAGGDVMRCDGKGNALRQS